MQDANDPKGTVKCARWAHLNEIDPIGSAGSYEHYVLLEWPLPWPRDFRDVAELAALQDFADSQGARLQALVPSARGDRRMTVFSRDHPFSGYRRAEGEVKDSPESTAVALVAQNAHFAARSPSEVLICTHGQRDRCCGSLGMALHKKLEAMPADTGLVHSRRTSHMGGHRFAPTALVFPEGTAWAFMNPQLLSAITSRTGPIDAALPYYRGCTGLDSGRQQALERAVLREVGWDMLDSARWGEDLGATTLLHVKSSHGQTSSWEADVHIGREVKVPDCGGTVANATKTESELVVSGLRQLA